MNTPVLAPNLTPTQTRHPELVSGSIVRHDLSFMWSANRAVSLPNRASAREEKWTLKRVQGDEVWKFW